MPVHRYSPFAVLFIFALQGCEDAARPCIQPQDAQKATLIRERADTDYELQLRQGEIDHMMAATKESVGVSSQWLQRKADLDEKIIQLRVKDNDLAMRIDAAR